jgi:hypothetical protein
MLMQLEFLLIALKFYNNRSLNVFDRFKIVFILHKRLETVENVHGTSMQTVRNAG